MKKSSFIFKICWLSISYAINKINKTLVVVNIWWTGYSNTWVEIKAASVLKLNAQIIHIYIFLCSIRYSLFKKYFNLILKMSCIKNWVFVYEISTFKVIYVFWFLLTMFNNVYNIWKLFLPQVYILWSKEVYRSSKLSKHGKNIISKLLPEWWYSFYP